MGDTEQRTGISNDRTGVADAKGNKSHALVLGAYGLIGSAIVAQLLRDGFEVTGVGRNPDVAQRLMPHIPWHFADIGQIKDWALILSNVDVVINASGALQDGAGDDLTAIHVTAVERLTQALSPRQTPLIHISAAGVSPDAPTEFYRTKARGDAIIRASDLPFVILRPTLVIGPHAYGGTALLRAAAAVPVVGPVVMPGAQVSAISVGQVAQAVSFAARGGVPWGQALDLTEAEVRSFDETLVMMRAWLGFRPWRLRVHVPRVLMALVAKGADVAGHLGWRAPLRSTALRQIGYGITGDPGPWQALVRDHGAPEIRPLPQVLRDMPATLQDRWFSRAYLCLPMLVLGLSLFWILSGVIGVFQFDAAQRVLTDRGMGAGLAGLFVGLGSAVDILLGIAALHRRFARRALGGMVCISLAYMLGASLFAVDLWSDPLGPMVKVLPGILAALTAMALLEER